MLLPSLKSVNSSSRPPEKMQLSLATEALHHLLLPARRLSPMTYSFLNMASFLSSAQQTLVVPSRPNSSVFSPLHLPWPSCPQIRGDCPPPVSHDHTSQSPQLRHSQNYTATDSQVCLYQWTTKLWEAGICARPWAINGFTTKGDVEGPHELNHGIQSPWQCQDKAQTWAGLTVQNLTLTTGTTVSTLHMPGTMWSSLFALCHLKGLSDLIYITWLPQCLTQSDHWTNVSNKSDILLIFRGHFLCQTVCQAWSMHCLTSHNSPGRRVFLYVPISQMKTPSLSWAKWSPQK